MPQIAHQTEQRNEHNKDPTHYNNQMAQAIRATKANTTQQPNTEESQYSYTIDLLRAILKQL